MQIRGTWLAGPGDDQARFLADLRALRDSAAIGCDELSARAHYPSDVLKEAENGPSLPGLPILTAFVRACDGDVLDWEERWRRLNPEVADDPNLPARPVGASAAAMAGARAGVSIAPPEVHDPERIKAALRGDRAGPEQAGRRVNSVPAPDAAPAERQDAGSGAAWAAGSGWDATGDRGVTSVNGDHLTGNNGRGLTGNNGRGLTGNNGRGLADHGSRGPFEAAFPGIPDPGERTEPAQAKEFSWLEKGTPVLRPPAGEPTRREQPQSGFGLSERDAGLSAMPAAEPAVPEPAVTEQAPWRQPDGLTSPERTDFWSKPVASVPSDLQRPGMTPRSDEPAIDRTSRSAPADNATEPARQARAEADPVSGVTGVSGTSAGTSAVAGVSGSARPQGMAGPTTQTAVGDQDRRKDRLFPVRLLAVIVIAALIGSVLVLLLK